MSPLKPDVQGLLNVNKIHGGLVLNQFSMRTLKAWWIKFGLGQVINRATATTTLSVGPAFTGLGRFNVGCLTLSISTCIEANSKILTRQVINSILKTLDR